MHRALELAARGLYTTTPNPRVGCVIVRDGVVVGEGFHARAGEPHAEIHALRAAGERARDATVYVTLEPCAHQGRTPPCAPALIAAGVRRVVIAMADPNPRVNGGGAAQLRAAGIEVQVGVLEDEARELNIGFVSRMTRGRPWMRMKIAASLDGKTALADGRSQWITGEAARRDGHAFRARACAVLTGVGTVRKDDPQLTVRDVETSRQPLKILMDSRLSVAPTARLFDSGPVLVVTASEDAARAAALRERGAEIVVLPNAQGKVAIDAMLRELERRELNEVHVETGFRLDGALMQEGAVDELLLYLAPCLLGGSPRGMFEMPEVASLDARSAWRFVDVTRVGEDLRLIARRAQTGS